MKETLEDILKKMIELRRTTNTGSVCAYTSFSLCIEVVENELKKVK